MTPVARVVLAICAAGVLPSFVSAQTESGAVNAPLAFVPQTFVRTNASQDGANGQVAETAVGKVGERRTASAIKTIAPVARLDQRIESRVQSRLQNRIDRYYYNGPATIGGAATDAQTEVRNAGSRARPRR